MLAAAEPLMAWPDVAALGIVCAVVVAALYVMARWDR